MKHPRILVNSLKMALMHILSNISALQVVWFSRSGQNIAKNKKKVLKILFLVPSQNHKTSYYKRSSLVYNQLLFTKLLVYFDLKVLHLNMLICNILSS